MYLTRKSVTVMVGLALFAASALCLRAQVKFSQVIAFGDSLSDAGNKELCTNPASASHMHLSGTWVQQLAEMCGYTLVPSKLGGTDYAKAGAVSGDLADQLKTYLAANAGSASPTALYTFFVGSNDIFSAMTDGQDGVEAATSAADNVKAAIDALAKAGGKNFIWLNMFPIALTPFWVGKPDCTPAVDAFNKEWTLDLAALRLSHPDIKLVAVDFYAFATTRAKNPTAQGFTNSNQAWLTAPASTPYSKNSNNPDADKFVFFDGLHPTTHFHQLLAQEAYHDLKLP